MVVVGVSRVATSAPPIRREAAQAAFGVRAEAASRSAGTVPSSGVAMSSLLAMQEAECGAQQDREARQHGEAVMEELQELQLALLGASEGDTTRLASLASRPVVASDPRLAGLLRAVQVRAAVELTRRSRAAAG